MRKPSPYLEQRRSFTSADIEWDVCGELPANLWDSIRWITLIPRLTDSSKISFGRTLSLRWKSRGLFPVYRIYWSVNRAHYHCTGFINVSGRELGFLHVQFTGPLLEPFSKVGMCLLLSLGTEVGFSTTLHTVFYNLSGFTFEFTSELSDKCSWSPMIRYTWFSWGFSPSGTVHSVASSIADLAFDLLSSLLQRMTLLQGTCWWAPTCFCSRNNSATTLKLHYVLH